MFHKCSLDARNITVLERTLSKYSWNIVCWLGRWTNEKPAPESILQFVTCNCQKSRCINNQCNCKDVGLLCTDLCKCKGCQNDHQSLEENEDEEENDDIDDSESDDEYGECDEEYRQ